MSALGNNSFAPPPDEAESFFEEHKEEHYQAKTFERALTKWTDIAKFAKKNNYSSGQIIEAERAFITRALESEEYRDSSTSTQVQLADGIRAISARETGVFLSREAEIMDAMMKEHPVQTGIMRALMIAGNTALFNAPRALSERLADKEFSQFMDSIDAHKVETREMFYEPMALADMTGSIAGAVSKFIPINAVATYATGSMKAGTMLKRAVQTSIALGLYPMADAPLKREMEEGFGNMLKERGIRGGKGAAIGLISMGTTSWIKNSLLRVPAVTSIYAGTSYAEARWLQDQSNIDALNGAAQSALMILGFQLSGMVTKPYETKLELRRVGGRLGKRLYESGRFKNKANAQKAADTLIERTDAVFSRRLRNIVRQYTAKKMDVGLTKKETETMRFIKGKFAKGYFQTTQKTNRLLRGYTTEDYIGDAVVDMAKAMMDGQELNEDYFMGVAQRILEGERRGGVITKKQISIAQKDIATEIQTFAKKHLPKSLLTRIGADDVSNISTGDFIKNTKAELSRAASVLNKRDRARISTVLVKLNNIETKWNDLTKASKKANLQPTSDMILVTRAAAIKARVTERHNKIAHRMQALITKATDEAYESEGLKQPKIAEASGITKGKSRSWSKRFFNEKHAKPENLISQMFDDGDVSVAGRILYGAINRGVDTQYRTMFEMSKYGKMAADAAGLTNKDLEAMSPYLTPTTKRIRGKLIKSTVPVTTVKLDSGKEIKLTRSNILNIYQHSKNPRNLKALATADYVKLEGHNVGRMTPKDIIKISRMVTPQERLLGDAASDIMRMTGKLGNKVSTELGGEAIFEVDPYWHIRRVDLPPKMLGKKVSGLHMVLENRSFMKRRQIKARAPMDIGDFFITLNNSVVDMSTYTGLAKPLRNAKLMLSDRAFSKAMRQKSGDSAINSLSDYLSRVEDSSYMRTPMGEIFGTLLRQGTRSALGLNLKVAPKQLISYGLIGDEVGEALMIKGITHFWLKGPGRAEMDLIERFIPQLQMRYQHGLISREVGNLAASHGLRKIWTGKDSFSDIIMRPIVRMDFQSIGRVIYVVTKEMEKTHPKLKPMSKEWGEVLNQRTMQIVRRTQPTWHPKDRSQIGGTRSKAGRLFTMFHSQKETTWNMLLKANADYRRTGNFENAAKTYARVAVAATMYGVVDYTISKHVYRQSISQRDLIFRAISSSLSLPYFFGDFSAKVVEYTSRGLSKEQPPAWGSLETLPANIMDRFLRASFHMSRAYIDYREGTKVKGKSRHWIELDKAARETALGVLMISGIPVYSPYMLGKGVYQIVTKEGQQKKAVGM